MRPVVLPLRLYKQVATDIFKLFQLSLLFPGFCLLLLFLCLFRVALVVAVLALASPVFLKFAEAVLLDQLAGTSQSLDVLAGHLDVNHVNFCREKTVLDANFNLDAGWHREDMNLEHLAKLHFEVRPQDLLLTGF